MRKISIECTLVHMIYLRNAFDVTQWDINLYSLVSSHGYPNVLNLKNIENDATNQSSERNNFTSTRHAREIQYRALGRL